MNFKETVMAEVDRKYQDMLNCDEKCPLNESISISEYEKFKTMRDNYYYRLRKEKDDFDKAISVIKNARQNRTKKETDAKNLIINEKRLLKTCLIISIIGFILMTVLVFCGLSNGVNIWAKESLLLSTGFKTFFMPYGAGTVSFVITCVIAGIIALIFAIPISKSCINDMSGDFCSALFALVFSLSLAGGLVFAISFLIIRLIIVFVGWIMFFLLNQYFVLIMGVGTFLTVLFVGKNITVRSHKIKYILNMIVVVILTIGLFCASLFLS